MDWRGKFGIDFACGCRGVKGAPAILKEIAVTLSILKGGVAAGSNK
jgi:hypothetical protein